MIEIKGQLSKWRECDAVNGTIHVEFSVKSGSRSGERFHEFAGKIVKITMDEA